MWFVWLLNVRSKKMSRWLGVKALAMLAWSPEFRLWNLHKGDGEKWLSKLSSDLHTHKHAYTCVHSHYKNLFKENRLSTEACFLVLKSEPGTGEWNYTRPRWGIWLFKKVWNHSCWFSQLTMFSSPFRNSDPFQLLLPTPLRVLRNGTTYLLKIKTRLERWLSS